ncbi:uncharacterized protein MELLADRAFT_111563 [Melampsora larici-populina 98AG31]|uniref:Uncharacterized protein n=1 Tax=Melampsora larici-populina (strain 98AG31 / pathotype 3-4-7) TaxID=747676 RepID=F4S3L5_MELLP|nr:uncharacterized protein MELLADRAFT_111563 [Melampsora larici-populina 98AG31]EGG00690.1 hypothetical protein MELLADRAFT_111563 [Melampsora larici-populina 98AG31]
MALSPRHSRPLLILSCITISSLFFYYFPTFRSTDPINTVEEKINSQPSDGFLQQQTNDHQLKLNPISLQHQNTSLIEEDQNSTKWYQNPSFFSDRLIYSPTVLVKPTKILFFADLEDFTLDSYVRTDTFFYETYEAAQKHPSIIAKFWGPGYSDYDPNEDWNQNINKRFGCGYFQIVFTHYGLIKIWDELLTTKPLECNTLLIVKGGDCNFGQCVKDSYLLNGNITLVRYANELVEMYSYLNILKAKNRKYDYLSDDELSQKFQFQLFGHVPDTANEWDFYPLDDWESKIYDAVLFGKINSYYPLRTTVAKAIQASQTFIVNSIKLPELDPNWKDLKPPKKLNWLDPSHDLQRKILQDFSKNMRQSKICVFDGSIEGKFIRKFSQAMLSGCVIASDLPNDHDTILKNNIIELKLNSTIEEINKAIKAALLDETELKRKASVLLRYARQHLTSTRELDLMIESADRYRNGERGYWFPTAFSAFCRRYNVEDPGIVPECFFIGKRCWTGFRLGSGF